MKLNARYFVMMHDIHDFYYKGLPGNVIIRGAFALRYCATDRRFDRNSMPGKQEEKDMIKVQCNLTHFFLLFPRSPKERSS